MLFPLSAADPALLPVTVTAAVPVPKPHKASRGPSEHDRELTDRARAWMMELGAVSVANALQVVWNSRLQTTAGTATARACRIDLNPRLREFGAEQVERTLKHEAAHLLAHWRSGRRRIVTHGVEWRQACADLGIPDETACHSLPFPRREVARKHHYQCPGCGIAVARVRRFSKHTACLRCCRKHNGGHYDARFQFVRTEPPAAE